MDFWKQNSHGILLNDQTWWVLNLLLDQNNRYSVIHMMIASESVDLFSASMRVLNAEFHNGDVLGDHVTPLSSRMQSFAVNESSINVR